MSDQMKQVVLETRSVSRHYRLGKNSIKALSDVSLCIHDGEFVAVTGPSGSGKSTLLNLLGGLDAPTSGQVFIEGVPMDTLDEKKLAARRRKHLGFVFQRHDLFPALTVAENIEFPLMLDQSAGKNCDQRVAELLSLVGLSEKANNLPEELSGGQQQRVGIARALANNPRILLADEPTGNLDSRTAEEIMDVLTSLCRLSGLTLVLVTHDPLVANRADRILSFQDGVLL